MSHERIFVETTENDAITSRNVTLTSVGRPFCYTQPEWRTFWSTKDRSMKLHYQAASNFRDTNIVQWTFQFSKTDLTCSKIDWYRLTTSFYFPNVILRIIFNHRFSEYCQAKLVFYLHVTTHDGCLTRIYDW